METNSTAAQESVMNVSIIDFATLFNVKEAAFSQWKFYDDSVYESSFKGPEPDAGAGYTSKELSLKRGRAA